MKMKPVAGKGNGFRKGKGNVIIFCNPTIQKFYDGDYVSVKTFTDFVHYIKFKIFGDVK